MLVTLIGRSYISKINLPDITFGNYWLTDALDDNKKLVNIEVDNGKWFIQANNNIKIANPKYMENSGQEKFLSDIHLNVYSKYLVYIGHNNEPYILYCLPNCEENIYRLKLEGKNEISIGSKQDCDICYTNDLVSETHAILLYNNNRWVIQNFDNKFGTFVNNKAIEESNQFLNDGDVIFIMGLKVVVIGKHICVSAPKSTVGFNREIFSLESVDYEVKEEDFDDDENIELYSDKEYFSRAPRIINLIEEETIKIEAPPQQQNLEEMPLILVLRNITFYGCNDDCIYY